MNCLAHCKVTVKPIYDFMSDDLPPGYLGFCIQIVTVAVCSMVSVHLAAKPAQAPWQPEKP